MTYVRKNAKLFQKMYEFLKIESESIDILNHNRKTIYRRVLRYTAPRLQYFIILQSIDQQ